MDPVKKKDVSVGAKRRWKQIQTIALTSQERSALGWIEILNIGEGIEKIRRSKENRSQLEIE